MNEEQENKQININDIDMHERIYELLIFLYHKDRLTKEFAYFVIVRTLREQAINKETADIMIRSIFNKGIDDVSIAELNSKVINKDKRDQILCGCVKGKLIDWNEYYDIRKGIKKHES